jgi:hypothetical protein
MAGLRTAGRRDAGIKICFRKFGITSKSATENARLRAMKYKACAGPCTRNTGALSLRQACCHN